MSTTNGERGRARAALVLPTVFAEQLVDRRVLLLGEATAGDHDRVLGGCRTLRVLDTGARGARSRGADEGREGARSRGADEGREGARGAGRKGRAQRVSPYRPGPLGFQPGAFDAAVVPEIAVLGEEAPDRLHDLARILDGGVLLVGTAAGAGIAYDTLYGWLADRFEHVRIFGEAPFEGVAVADFEAGIDPEVVVDGSLAGEPRTPRAFFALASDSPIDDAPAYTVVELPAALEAEAPEVVEPRVDATERDEDAAARRRLEAQVEAAVEHAEGLEAEMERLRASLEEARRKLAAAAVERESPAAVEHAEREAAREIEALEARLVERAHHVLALEAEVERRGRLVRDAVEEARELRRLGGGGGDGSAVERALAAEAARAEAQFQVDELRARLRECEEGVERGAGATAAAVEARAEAAEVATRALELREAELAGRVRGLRSRLLEQAELHELAASRLSLAEAALDERRETERRLERQLAETHDQLELALVKAHGPVDGDVHEARIRELTASEERLSARVGELSNQLVAAQDLASSLAASAAAPPAGAQADAQEIERRRGLETGLRLRLANVERAFAARAVEARRGAAAVDTVDDLRTELAAIKAENSALTIQLADIRDAEGDLRARAGDLTSALAARDALVTRLQLELSQREQQVKAAEQRVARLDEETKGLRAAVVEAATSVEAHERAERELEGLRQQLGEARERARHLEAARVELEERISRLEADRAVVGDRVAGIEAEKSEFEARARQIEAEKSELEARAQRIEAEKDRAEARAQRIEAEKSEFEARAQRIEAERVELADRLLHLAAERAELEERVQAVEAAGLAPAGGAEMDERVQSVEAELEVMRAHADALERERDDARRVLAETREALEGLRSDRTLDVPAGQSPELGRELRDRDLLLRSLTAQLEERNDRIRALERRLSGSIPAAPPDDELMRRQLLELQERSVRLAEELAAERDARRMVESRLVHYESRPELDEELARARDELGRFRQDLDLERGRAEGFERDVRSLREVCVEARHGLEGLLGEATSSGDQATADRLGRLLTILGRY